MTVPTLTAFGFDADYQALYDTAYRYARDVLHPLCKRMDDEDWFPEDAFRALAAQGLLGVTVPAAYGGGGMDVLAQCFITEAVAYWNHTIAAGMLASDNLCLHNLVRNANADQKRRYLPGFC
ncbi:MAG: acyl-CoA dehydrogenase family protein, partial [Gammaproteobacteria bacterium]